MKKKFLLMALLVFSLAATAQNPKEILKAVKKHDKAVYLKPGWIRDPYIYLAPDGFYYLTGTTPTNGDKREIEDKYNLGLSPQAKKLGLKPSLVGYQVRVWKSKDLANWEYVGEPFSLDRGFWAQQQPEAFKNTPKEEWFLWAPEMYYADGKWVAVHTSPSPVKNGANLIIMDNLGKSNKLEFPMGKDVRDKHDPSLFRDDDGTWYMTWSNTLIAPLKPGFTGLAADPVRIDPSNRVIGHEGATLKKIGKKYVHFGTAWSTDQGRKGSYNLYYCTSDNITGPYSERRFVGRFLGHGTPFMDKDGKWWCTAFFNGNVPPLPKKGIQTKDLSETAQTINEQGTAIVPLEVKIQKDGDVYIRAIDPDYATPGPDEVQKF